MAPQSNSTDKSVDEMVLDIEHRIQRGERLLEECPEFRLGRTIRLGGGLVEIEDINP